MTEAALHAAGFQNATVGSVKFGLSGTTLTNISLDGTANNNIGHVGLYATLGDAVALKLTKVAVSDAHIRLPVATSGGGNAGALNLFTKEITLDNSSITAATPQGDVRVDINGSVVERDNIYNVKAQFTTAQEFLKADGQLTLKLHRNGDIESYVELYDARVSLPDIDMKRASGWVEASLKNGQPLPEQLNAQMTFGAINAYGLPLKGMTLTAASSPAGTQVLLNGVVTGDSGEIVADIKTDNAASVTALVDTTLKNLDALGIDKLKGQGKFTLNLSANKDAAAAWQDIAGWKDIKGDVTLSARNLGLPGLIDGAEGDAKAAIGFDPATSAVKITTDGASFSEKRFSAKNASAALTLYMHEDPVIEGKLNIGEMTVAAKPAYVVPVRVALEFQPLSSAQHTTGFRGDVTEKNGLLTAIINGRHDTSTGSGRADINMPPLTLTKGVHTLADIFPVTAEYVSDTAGTIGLRAQFGWGGKSVTSSGELFLKDFTASVEDNVITDINAVVKLDSVVPPVVNKQTVSIGMLNVGLPVTNGLVEASLDAKNNFTLHRAEWDLAKGRVTSSAFTTPLSDITAEATLTATGLDLPELFRIAPMEGLDATGTVDGTIPLKIVDGNLSIANGVLESRGGGALRYNPTEIPAFLQRDDKAIADLRVALKAFEFESLKMTLNGEIGKEQKIGLSIKGKNPEFYDGHPVSLNLNVEGPLENVLRYNPGSSRIPDSIKKQLEQYEKQNASK